MLLVADIGNTNSVLGIFDGDNLVKHCRLSSSKNKTSDEWAITIQTWLAGLANNIDSLVYSSVVPQVNLSFEAGVKLLGVQQILQVNDKLKLPFTFNYEQSHTIGSDRLVNAAAGVNSFGENLIIADFGTAITFCLIINKVYEGGVIAPGIQSSLSALFSNTSQLPSISINSCNSILGKSTTDSLVAGSYFGWKGLINEILIQLRALYPNLEFTTIATGGVSDQLSLIHEQFDIIDKNLTLRGLKDIHYLNHGTYNSS